MLINRQDILKKHRNGHWPDSSWHWREPNFFSRQSFEVGIALGFSFYFTDADINDYRPVFHKSVVNKFRQTKRANNQIGRQSLGLSGDK